MREPTRSLLSNLSAGLALASLLLAVPGSAQSDMDSRLRPITAKVKNAGTLHLGTGTWTRAHGSQAFLGTSDVIVYANTCESGYYAGQHPSGGEIWTDEGAIPDQGQGTVPSTYIPGSNDADFGCAASYNITGFQVGYCTYQAVFTANVTFYDNYEPVGTFCAVPGVPTATFALTGLPASTPGVESCWLVALDVNGAGNFTLTGTGTNPNQFGWSFNTSSPGDAATPDGPLVAGAPSVCSGTDATRWDRGTSNFPIYPANQIPGGLGGTLPLANEQGTGMWTQDVFRVDGVTTWPAGPGCFFLGSTFTFLLSFHLELYSDVNPCPDPCFTSCGNTFCHGSTSCPCGMAPTNSGAGCNNESNTGGAVLSASGNASVSADLSAPAVFLNLTHAPPFKTSVFIQGTSTIAAVPFGDGQRCVSGQLIRLNAPPPPPVPPGDPTNGNGSLTYPTTNHPLSITQRCQQAAQPIFSGDTRHYFAQYRDPSPNACNVSLGGTVNTSQALTIVWAP
jgi:hypothetical protein